MCDSVTASNNFVCQYYSTSDKVVGRVKWFNSKTGFGFITRLGTDTDIFVHHSELMVKDEQYRYLVQGEYVEFSLAKPEDTSKFDIVAKQVAGVCGNLLMCETRRLLRLTKPGDDCDEEGFQPVTRPKVRGYPPRGGGPRQLSGPPSTPTQKGGYRRGGVPPEPAEAPVGNQGRL